MAAYLFYYIIDTLDDIPSLLSEYLEERELSMSEFLLWLMFHIIFLLIAFKVFVIMCVYLFANNCKSTFPVKTSSDVKPDFINYAPLVNPVLRSLYSMNYSETWVDSLNEKLNDYLHRVNIRRSHLKAQLKCQNTEIYFPEVDTITLSEKQPKATSGPVVSNGDIPNRPKSTSTNGNSSQSPNLTMDVKMQEINLHFALNIEKNTSRTHVYYFDVDVTLKSSVVIESFLRDDNVSNSVKIFPKLKYLNMHPNYTGKSMDESDRRVIKSAFRSSIMSIDAEQLQFYLRAIVDRVSSAKFSVSISPKLKENYNDSRGSTPDNETPVNGSPPIESDSQIVSSCSSLASAKSNAQTDYQPPPPPPISSTTSPKRTYSRNLSFLDALGSASVESTNQPFLFDTQSFTAIRSDSTQSLRRWRTPLSVLHESDNSTDEKARPNGSRNTENGITPPSQNCDTLDSWCEQAEQTVCHTTSGNYNQITLEVQVVKFTIDKSLLAVLSSSTADSHEATASNLKKKLKFFVQLELNAPHLSPKTKSIELKSNNCVFWDESRQFLLTDKSSILRVKLYRDDPEELLSEDSLDITDIQSKYFRGSRQIIELHPVKSLQLKNVSTVGIITLECVFKDQNWTSNSKRNSCEDCDQEDTGGKNFPDVLKMRSLSPDVYRAVPARGGISPENESPLCNSESNLSSIQSQDRHDQYQNGNNSISPYSDRKAKKSRILRIKIPKIGSHCNGRSRNVCDETDIN